MRLGVAMVAMVVVVVVRLLVVGLVAAGVLEVLRLWRNVLALVVLRRCVLGGAVVKVEAVAVVVRMCVFILLRLWSYWLGD